MKINDNIIKLAAQVYQLENQKRIIESELKPLREELLDKVEVGTHECGDHIVIKKHVDATFIEGYNRKPYDSIQVK